MNEEDKSIRRIKNIADAITDNIINTPDDEILDEAREDHGDHEYEANIMRNIIALAPLPRQLTKRERRIRSYMIETLAICDYKAPTVGPLRPMADGSYQINVSSPGNCDITLDYYPEQRRTVITPR